MPTVCIGCRTCCHEHIPSFGWNSNQSKVVQSQIIAAPGKQWIYRATPPITARKSSLWSRNKKYCIIKQLAPHLKEAALPQKNYQHSRTALNDGPLRTSWKKWLWEAWGCWKKKPTHSQQTFPRPLKCQSRNFKFRSSIITKMRATGYARMPICAAPSLHLPMLSGNPELLAHFFEGVIPPVLQSIAQA